MAAWFSPYTTKHAQTQNKLQKLLLFFPQPAQNHQQKKSPKPNWWKDT